ncbi:MAG: MFS transporter [Gammaproteobacteria bacterium]|nr:MFS transporter [Gammaproteobacteria bacterium]
MSDPSTVQDTENPYKSKKVRNYALGLLTLGYCFNFIDRQLLSILQEAIKVDLNLSDGQLGLLTGFAFAMFYVSAGIPIARWADRGNRKNIVSLAIGIWSLMTAVSGLAQNYLQLFLARVGVGIGEAGGSPPSHSIISDIFPAEKRATAISIYSTGVNVGILFGFLLGGWLNEFFGWRVAFAVVGLPGLLIALVIRYTIKEPIRGLSDGKKVEEVPPLGEVLGLLWSRSSFRHIALGAGLNAFAAYGTVNWQGSFFIRLHGMSTGELGTWLALSSGFLGAVGILAGGMLADKLAPRDKRWYVWIPAIVGFIGVPFFVAVFTIESTYAALILSCIPGTLINVYLGNSIATSHALVGARMRAMASAILFFILNLIGLGLGPLFIGLLSDYLAPTLGVESLRYAMVYLIPTALFWSSCHFMLAARTLRDDLANAPD